MAMEDFDALEQPLEKDQGSQIDFEKYLRGIWKRKWLIIALACITAVPFYLIAKNQVPVYKVRVTIQDKNISDKDVGAFNRETQAEIKSQSCTERIACELGLALSNSDTLYESFDDVFLEYHTDTNPVEARYKIVIDELGSYYLVQKDDNGSTAIDSANVWDAVDALRSANGISFRLNPSFCYKPGEFHFRTRPFDKGVKFLQFSVEKSFDKPGTFMALELKGEDPDYIAKQLNRVAEAYRQEVIKLKALDTDDYRDMLHKKMAEAEKNMEQSESNLRQFYSRYPLSLEAEKKNLESRLVANEAALRELPAQRRRLTDLLMKLDSPEDGYEQQYRRVVVNEIAHFSGMANEPELTIYRQNLANFEKEYDEVATRFSSQHQDAVNYAQKIRETQDKIIQFASNYRTILAEEESKFRKDRVELEAKLRALPVDEGRLMELERNRTIDEELYKNYIVEVKRLQVADASTAPGIRILDRAARPSRPINPSKKSRVMLGGGLGFLLGLIISIGIDAANRSLQTLKDIERHLKLPVLGTIPVVSFKDIPDFRDDQKALQIDRQLVTHDYKPTPVGEAYRALRTQLLFARGAERVRTLLITSISPEEGKSFTAANLAIIMAQQRTNTLLVDADLRRGVQHNTFAVAKEPGLTNFLSNKATLAGLIQPTHVPNLSVLSCGALIPNPSELLGSMQMRRFIAEVRRKFDFIIFDAPPLDAATDSVVISTLVDAVTIVVRAGKTNRNNAKERLDIFRSVPAHLAGVVVNGTEQANLKSSYSYYHY